MTDPDPDRGPADLQHPRFARAYARAVEGMNIRGATEHRRALLHGLNGRVVEIGAGDGSNFSHYPAMVTEVLAVEPDDHLRSLARSRASSAPVPVRVVAGTAEEIPAADGSADAVVASLVLCSVSDQSVALAEARRVLRPGGVLAFYEHVRSDRTVLAALEDLLTPLWHRAAGGCHPNRDTLESIVAAGFEVRDTKRFGFSVQPLVPPVAHILGHAVSPASS
ncbi:Ubiquinone/menaquinone biosynthesis C-methylase UbiE [Arthrobacter subterraneus]|uniref:Ubiquinone/menaquinone biosynthesis C-methylase UbiE n=1 Tax=Arthrobacter subterraneus TaxID=335973 RepID=A0A1G8H241_9MICC|nr:class I SAM-dependent methyltransferase [Arthrobacter subterraneus]SDI00694.1 Ubiquinone/menaquinone biosynthesis C-methylase UbiE [Arthrobacter subterraneus]